MKRRGWKDPVETVGISSTIRLLRAWSRESGGPNAEERVGIETAISLEWSRKSVGPDVEERMILKYM